SPKNASRSGFLVCARTEVGTTPTQPAISVALVSAAQENAFKFSRMALSLETDRCGANERRCRRASTVGDIQPRMRPMVPARFPRLCPRDFVAKWERTGWLLLAVSSLSFSDRLRPVAAYSATKKRTLRTSHQSCYWLALSSPLETEFPLGGSLAMAPETRYAMSGDINIAYQVIGNGPRDLILVPGWVSNIEVLWDEPIVARFLRRLASFSRLILFDKRGTGLSDRLAGLP